MGIADARHLATPSIRPDIAAAGARLAAARALRTPCAPIRDLLGPDDLDAAYLVQSAWVADRIAHGARVVGRKIGLTNAVVQAQLGVDQPDFGVLLDEMTCGDGEVIDTSRLLQPRIEAEIAFLLGQDLNAEALTEDAVTAATAGVVAALEIVDSRVAGWDITIVDTIADNASSGLFVVGTEPRPLDLDLADCLMTMSRGEEVVSTGTGAACLGSPLTAMTWLANKAYALGRPLRAGDVVLSGALGPMVAVGGGDVFRADITGLGTVTAVFAGPT